MAAPANRVLLALASPRWMLAFFAFAGLSAVLSIKQPAWITQLWLPPLGLFGASLLAAIVTRPRFRRDPLLLAMHLSLLVMIILFGIARLTYLEGGASLTEKGEPFTGRLDVDRRGPLHGGELAQLNFSNLGTIEDFRGGGRWHGTINRIAWLDAGGHTHHAEISNDKPLLLRGYRIQPTFNRGYAPIFRWESEAGGAETGSVQLRADREFGMANEWTLPSGERVWVMLEPLGRTTIQPGEMRSGLGAAELPHQLIVRHGPSRSVMQIGDTLPLPGGQLVYLGLSNWIGYRISYDPTAHWVAASVLLFVVSLIGYYGRLAQRPIETSIVHP